MHFQSNMKRHVMSCVSRNMMIDQARFVRWLLDFMGEMMSHRGMGRDLISLRQGQSLVEAVTSANATRAMAAMVKTWRSGDDHQSIGVHGSHM